MKTFFLFLRWTFFVPAFFVANVCAAEWLYQMAGRSLLNVWDGNAFERSVSVIFVIIIAAAFFFANWITLVLTPNNVFARSVIVCVALLTHVGIIYSCATGYSVLTTVISVVAGLFSVILSWYIPFMIAWDERSEKKKLAVT